MLGDFSVASQIGLMPRASAPGDTGVAAPTERAAVASDGVGGLFSLSNPLLWFGMILAVTVGAASAAGSVRVGKIRLSAAAGGK